MYRSPHAASVLSGTAMHEAYRLGGGGLGLAASLDEYVERQRKLVH